MPWSSAPVAMVSASEEEEEVQLNAGLAMDEGTVCIWICALGLAPPRYRMMEDPGAGESEAEATA